MADKTSMGKYKNINPGPGAYNPNDLDNMHDKPNYTFGLKTEKARLKKKVPGPGTYDHYSHINKRPSSKFGR